MRKLLRVILLGMLATLPLSGCGGGGGGSSSPINYTPVADAGMDQTVATGATVTLNGSNSSDQNGDSLTFNWSITSKPVGSTAELSSTNNIRPNIVPDVMGQYVIQLIVNDGIADSSPDSITITAVNGYTIGGTVSGLAGTMTIQNNSANTMSISSNGPYSFPILMTAGEIYNISVLSSPPGHTCSVSNGSGIISGNVANINITCFSSLVPVSLSGTVSSAAGIQIDSDINDPSTSDETSNNTFATAQSIANFTTVNGFASKTGTGGVFGDIFATLYDEFDVYAVHLQANQTIKMQVVDFNGTDTYQGDLDLYAFDSSYNLIDYSEATGEFEEINIMTEGDYYITVQAYNGISKYVLSIGQTNSLNTNTSKGSGADFKINEAVVKFKATTLKNSIQNTTSTTNYQIQHFNPGRDTLIRFANMDHSAIITAQSLNPPAPASVYDELAVHNPESLAKILTLGEIKKLNARQDVEYAEPNFIYHPTRVPNDSYYSYQWHYPAINLPQAWDITTGTPAAGNVIVAIIDTGIVLAHPDLQGQLVSGYDFVSDPTMSNDGNGIDSDPNDPGDNSNLGSSSWHGTHVGGTVAAKTNNASGVAGVSWGAKLMPIRVLGIGGGTNYDIREGVRFAAGLSNDSGTVPAQKADIINLSLGGSGASQADQDVFDEARAAGVIVIAAAGNDNTSQLFYPASYENVISVSATDYNDALAPYSNYGTMIDIAAPGGDVTADSNNDGRPDGILSTLVDDSSGSLSEIYKFYNGTSMASPHVAGIMALMKAVHPGLTPADIDALIQNGDLSNEAGTTGRDNQFGYGIIDALKAVTAAQNLSQGGTLPAIIVTSKSSISFASHETSTTLTLSNVGGGADSVTAVTDNADWLTVAATSVDADGLGEYTLTVDRTGLNDNSYLTTVTFTLTSGNSVQVMVSMKVSSSSDFGDAGAGWILLLDENYQFVDQRISTSIGNGQYSYTLNNVLPGNYYIIGGSDIDNDLWLCQYGENCGSYPVLGSTSRIEVTNSDLNNLDFTVDILTGIGGNAANTTMGDHDNGFQLNSTKQKLNIKKKVKVQ
ncbi:MAG: S8 family serine peptidase [Proteobacteria bacterium]|nr:S8 family serine peptidase [Pseudomonadota bacterium]MBU1716432.1 S8 family serine peptidase [Pseudomonadota bacterium]